MRCSECGFDNPPDDKFCTKCGTTLEAPPPPAASETTCPQCGSEVSPEALFCGECGANLANLCPQCGIEAPAGIRFCTKCGQDLTKGVTRQVARAAVPRGKGALSPGALPLPNIIAAAVGGILMLISLTVTWYTIRLDTLIGQLSDDVSAGDLITKTGDWEWWWPGSVLPLILMIIFASVVLLSIGYSLWRGVMTRSLWVWLGVLSALCVLGNAVYFLWYVHDRFGEWVNIVNVGFVIAFIGALVVMFSSIGSRRAT